MKMEYTKPVAELEKFALADVVTTSGKPGSGLDPGRGDEEEF